MTPMKIGSYECRTIRDYPTHELYRELNAKGDYSPDGQMIRKELARRESEDEGESEHYEGVD